MTGKNSKSVAVIVAHPDDETLWSGGTILSHPSWTFFILSLTRSGDTNRAPRFYQALKTFGATGLMGDLDDGPEQIPLDGITVEQVILKLLPQAHFDLIISHNPNGEYTKHVRHEEVGKAVIKLWHTDKIIASELWTFAYEDGNKAYYPKPIKNATIYRTLTRRIWLRKFSIITETYGFGRGSFEAETTPRTEAFWRFTKSYDAYKWLKNKGIKNESTGII